MPSASGHTAQTSSSTALRYLAAAALCWALTSVAGSWDTLPDPVLVINGEPVGRELFLRYAEQRAPDLGPVSSLRARRAAAEELILQTLLVQEARRLGLDAEPAVQLQMELATRGLLASAALEHGLQRLAPESAELEAAQAEALAEASVVEYRLRHILTATPQDALALIARLEAGESFVRLAREESLDASAHAGGDLGWVSAPALGAELATAVAGVTPGSHSAEPVRTRFGWHVLRLEAVRESAPGDPVAVRARVHERLLAERLERHLQLLRSTATIENRAAPP